MTAEQRSLNTIGSFTSFSKLKAHDKTRNFDDNKFKYLLHINIQGLRKKVEELNIYLEENKNIDIISLNEHWLQNDNLCCLNLLKDFDVISYYVRSDGAKRGGTALLVRNSAGYTTKIRDDLENFGEDYVFECCAVEIEELQSVFISLYRVPYHNTFNTFLTKLDKFLNRLSGGCSKRVVLCTDCNIDTLTRNSDVGNGRIELDGGNRCGQKFINILKLNGFSINNNTPTRVSQKSQTCIDHIITNYTSHDLYKTLVYDIGLSDHSAVFFPITCLNRKTRPLSFGNYSRKLNESTVSFFLDLIGSVRWEVDCCRSVDEMFKMFMTKFLNCFNESFPKTVVKHHRRDVLRWVTRGIRVSSKHKRELHEQAKAMNDSSTLAYYKLYRKIFKKVVKAAKKITNDRFISKSKCKSKASWRVIKDETGLIKNNNHSIKEIINNGTSIQDPNLIAESFNLFYPNTRKHIACPSIYTDNITIGSSTEQITSEFKLRKVTVKEIEKIIDNLKNTKATGWDEIPVSLLKASKTYISHPLSKIVNRSFKLGEFPSNLKFSVMKPIYKKGSKTEMSNYRPISLLPVVSKVIETAVYVQLYHYLNVNKILHRSQYGFRNRLSTISAISKLTNEIYKSLDEQYSTAAICFDLSMAFDCVNHTVLLEKLKAYGVHGTNLVWFNSYLSGRCQRTMIKSNDGHSHYSNWVPVHSGIPQGSVLGPLLFIIYVNDLALNISSEIIQFADDTTAIVKNKSDVEVMLSIDRISNEMALWCKNNCMKMNVSKTTILGFKSKHSDDKTVAESKILGIIVDDRMNWKAHICYISKKLSCICYNMRRLVGITSLDVRKTVYYGYFYPNIKYGVVLWGSSVDAGLIFKLQKRVVRNMLGVPMRTSCKPLFKHLQLLTLPCLFIYETVVCVMSNFDCYSNAKITHDYNTRNKDMLVYPRHRTTLYEYSTYYMGMKLYNKARSYIDMAQPTSIIKRNLHHLLLEKAFYTVGEFLNE
jgi:hypothetical protein